MKGFGIVVFVCKDSLMYMRIFFVTVVLLLRYCLPPKMHSVTLFYIIYSKFFKTTQFSKLRSTFFYTFYRFPWFCQVGLPSG